MASKFIQQIQEKRNSIVRRDGGKCRWCGCAERLEVHHVLPTSKGGTNDPSNLITLCYTCHKQWHREQSAKEAAERRRAKGK